MFRILRARDKIDQYLAGYGCASYQKMTQISFVGDLMEIRPVVRPAEFKYAGENAVEIFVHDLAVVSRQNIVGAVLPVKTKSQFAVLFHVSEGIFHLVAVTFFCGTRFDTLEYIVREAVPPDLPALDQRSADQRLDFAFLQRKLFRIRKCAVGAAAAARKKTASGVGCLENGWLKNLQKLSF